MGLHLSNRARRITRMAIRAPKALPYPEKARERSVGLRLGYVARRMHGMRGGEEGKTDDSVLATQAR